MRESVRERILQNIQTTLEGINETAGYNFTVGRVERMRAVPLAEDSEFPALFIYETSERIAQGPNPLLTKELTVIIQTWLRSGDNDLSVQMNGITADIETAMFADVKRGGLAVDTDVVEHVFMLDTPIEVLAALHSVFIIHYRTVEGNPYQES